MYGASQLRVSPSATLDTYMGSLGAALGKSAEVKEYELLSFSRAVGKQDYNGTPELGAAALTYRGVEQDLLRMDVPTDLRVQHLELLQAVSLLAQTTGLLANWSGDPIDALAYIDAFSKAERSVQLAINNVFAQVTKIGKQS